MPLQYAPGEVLAASAARMTTAAAARGGRSRSHMVAACISSVWTRVFPIHAKGLAICSANGV